MKEKIISGADECKCGHPRYQHDKFGCQTNMFDVEEECDCKKFCISEKQEVSK